MSEAMNVVDVPTTIDEQPLSRYQIFVMALCGLALFMDGFDTAAIGYVAPSLSKAWGLKAGTLGPVFGAGLFGLMIGALVLSPLADRIGRRYVIVFSSLFFGICALATAFATSVDQLFWIRLLTGLGLGGVMPNAIAMTSEFAPKRLRSTAVMVTFFGFALGSGLGGSIAAVLVLNFGWQSVFVFGGVLPLIFTAVLLTALPESIRVLTLRGTEAARVAALLARINPALRFDPSKTRFTASDEPTSKRFPVALLFHDGRAAVTLLLWVMFFVNLFELYFLANWLPTVAQDAGLSERLSMVNAGMIHLGGMFGAVLFGRIVDRVRPFPALAGMYLMSGVFVACIGLSGSTVPLFMISTFLSGFCIVGAQLSSNAVAAAYYPTVMRSTGVGWALGVGRFGSVIGPILGGIVIGLHWPISTMLTIGALPTIAATLAALTAGWLVDLKANRVAAADSQSAIVMECE